MTKNEFKEFYMAMFGFYPHQVQADAEIQRLWYEMLKQLDYSTISEGLKRWAVNNKWMPTISDIVTWSLPDQMNAADAWSYLVSFIQHHGSEHEERMIVVRTEYDDYQYHAEYYAKLAACEKAESHFEALGHIVKNTVIKKGDIKFTCDGQYYEAEFIVSILKPIPNHTVWDTVRQIGYKEIRNAVYEYMSVDNKNDYLTMLNIKQQFEFLYNEITKNKRASALGLPCESSAVVRDVLSSDVDLLRLLEDNNVSDYDEEYCNDDDDEDDPDEYDDDEEYEF